MSEKIYCGSAKTVNTKYGDLIKVSFSKKDIDTMQENLKNGWINLVIKEKKEKVEGKPTHYLEVDSWQPTERVDSVPSAAFVDDDQLPF